MMIDGFVFRFAACQLSQKTAGSPLGSLVRAMASFFVHLMEPVHVAAWVDDLIFVMFAPEHGKYAGFDWAVPCASCTTGALSRCRRCGSPRCNGSISRSRPRVTGAASAERGHAPAGGVPSRGLASPAAPLFPLPRLKT